MKAQLITPGAKGPVSPYDTGVSTVQPMGDCNSGDNPHCDVCG